MNYTNSNRNRILLFAGLGVLAAAVSILAKKKLKKGGSSRWVDRDEEMAGAPSMKSFGGATK